MSPVPFGEALRTWARIGLLSFGGPAGQIALMHRELVEEKRWISEERFLHALNYCMLLPGPEAQQLATYVGWILHGTRGGLAAGLLFVLPGALCVLLLSVLYAQFQRVASIEALFFGLKAAVLAIVLQAVLRIGRRVLKSRFQLALAALAFVAMFFLGAPFPWIVLASALIGLARPDLFPAPGHALPAGPGAVDRELERGDERLRPRVGRTLRVAGTWLVLWFAPVALLALLLGRESVFVRVGTFFGQTAVVTFGGAYAVLAHVADHAVQRQGWLAAGEMLDGLGLAETTPGPLILVLEFVGFLAGYRDPGALAPLAGGCLAAAVTLWTTFAPCFLWIFAGAPWVEALRGRRAASAALAAIPTAVVGVVLDLALWFGLHVCFGTIVERRWHGLRLLVPEFASLDLAAVALSLLAGVLLFRTRLGMLATLGISAALGLALRTLL